MEGRHMKANKPQGYTKTSKYPKYTQEATKNQGFGGFKPAPLKIQQKVEEVGKFFQIMKNTCRLFSSMTMCDYRYFW